MALREARREDVRRIVEMLADDEVSRGRDDGSGDMSPYYAAFDVIEADPNNMLYVWDEGGAILGCLQLTFLPGMSYRGSWLAQVEGVRVDSSRRGQRIGEKMMGAMIVKSRARGCKQLQLKTDKRRIDAQRFYKRLGFASSHEGMKLALD